MKRNERAPHSGGGGHRYAGNPAGAPSNASRSMTLISSKLGSSVSLLSISPREAAAAFEQVRADIEALPPGEMVRITAHVPTVVSIAIGALPNLEAARAQIAKQLPFFDLAELDKLPAYTRALYHAYLLTLPSADAQVTLQTLLAEAAPLRERLLVVAEGLVHFNLADRERVASIRRGTGHLDTANDLVALAHLFQSTDSSVLARTLLTPAEIERASELGWAIVSTLGQRRVGTNGGSAPNVYEDACVRLFRLVVRTYDQGRRALGYLRWNEGDLNEKMPSLYSRSRARRAVVEVPAPEGEEGPEQGEAGEVISE
jgi:hypothetical protein